MIADTRPPNGAWAPGNYECLCVSCRESFIGDKRAMACAECAYNDGWRPIKSAPKHERILVCNELWGDTFGEVQIASQDDDGWTFDSEMNINDMDDVVDELTTEDFQPLRWKPLPNPPKAIEA